MKTPKRINGALDLFEKLVCRHGKCGYKPLLNKACPSKVRPSVPENHPEFIMFCIQIKGNVRKADILVRFNPVLPSVF